MAKFVAPTGSWAAIGTQTTVATLFTAYGDVYITTESTSGLLSDDGLLLEEGRSIVIPAGLTVSARTKGESMNSVIVHRMPFGV